MMERDTGQIEEMIESLVRLKILNISKAESMLSILTGAALVLYGISRKSLGGLSLAILSSGLIYRGLTRHSFIYEKLGINTNTSGHLEASNPVLSPDILIEKAITINESPEKIYTLWRNFENLPHFMSHLRTVRVISSTQSHWIADAPFGSEIVWDAEITEDIPNQKISWQSSPGALVPNSGSVYFEKLPEGRGTSVKVIMDYAPPAGPLAATLAKIFSEDPSRQVYDDLRRLKQIIETGEVPTTYGQPSGRRGGITESTHKNIQ